MEEDDDLSDNHSSDAESSCHNFIPETREIEADPNEDFDRFDPTGPRANEHNDDIALSEEGNYFTKPVLSLIDDIIVDVIVGQKIDFDREYLQPNVGWLGRWRGGGYQIRL
ncbi:hypothetical protein Syun_029352 [Stephania yunnanensis]|uniref:Uncharacterized protein n=1 Tax=Stephania yunnanensis TaxID=152371 RepID=A0AAP0E8F8_9MAGN